ncbi:hypothetical protein GCM10027343_37230 [Noviherbaspirillum agri]
MKLTAEQRNDLCVEIFRITGLQVDNVDPVIICALMQSHYVRQAGADVVSEIEKSTKAALASLTEAMNANSRDAVKMISQEVTSSIRSNVSAETDRAKGVLAKFADSLRAGLAGSKAPVLPPAPARYDMKTVGIVAGAVALSSIVAAMVFSPLSAQEREQLEFGKAVLQAIPALDAKTKRGLADAIASVGK